MQVFMEEAYRQFKRLKPEAIFYNNLAAMHPRPSYVLLPDGLAYNDLVGTEGGFMVITKTADLWFTSITAKTLEGLAPAKSRVIFMAGDNKPWSWYQHTAAETKLCIASTLANGSNIWYGLHGSTALLATPGGRAAGEILTKLAALEKYYTDTVSAAKVAMLYSYDTEKIYKTSIVESDLYAKGETSRNFAGNFRQALYGFGDMLARSQIPYDIINDLELTPAKLARYECLLLPTSAVMSDRTVALLRDYVRGGGNLIASFDTSLYLPGGESRANFGLAEVFGADFAGKLTNYFTWNYFAAEAAHPVFAGVNIPLYPAPAIGLDVTARSGAEVLARYLGARPGRYDLMTKPDRPAIIFNRYGKGQCLYLAGTFAEFCYSHNPPEYRLFLKNAVKLLSLPLLEVEGQLGNIEVVLRKQPGRLLVHLINFAGLYPRPFEAICPQPKLKIYLHNHPKAPSQVQALFAGTDCKFSFGRNKVTIRLPVLNEYEVLAVE
jgi:hypothetical protein